MIEVNTSELKGPALDWAVAQIEEPDGFRLSLNNPRYWVDYAGYAPSTDWSQGGPLLDEWDVQMASTDNDDGSTTRVRGYVNVMGRKPGSYGTQTGSTILIAVMRAIVASRFGDTVSVPACLL